VQITGLSPEAPGKPRHALVDAAFALDEITSDRRRRQAPTSDNGPLDRHSNVCKNSRMYWLYILALAIILYVLGSIRVLRQYERGVVFLLGNLRAFAGRG
jgi:hypothetical protein